MKKVIICEGKHDGVLIEQLLKKIGFSHKEIYLFNQNKVSMQRKKRAETDILGRFISKKNPYKILIKLEGGKHSAIKIFSSNMSYCIENIDLLVLMIDLETGNAEEKIEDLKNVLKTLRKPTPITLNFEGKKDIEHLHHFSASVNIEKTGEFIGKFEVIFFKSSLEQSCGINKDKTTTDEERKDKIDKFLKDSERINFFSKIIK